MNSTHAVAKPPADTYRVVRKRVAFLKPSPENESLYRPVSPDDPEIVDLAASIKRDGLHEPLVITADRYIVSGHRRHAALLLAGQKQAPCRVLSVRRSDLSADEFIAMLRDHNRQRTKSAAEAMREAIVDVDLEQAISNLNVRRRSSLERYRENGIGEFLLDGTKKRHGIRMSEKGDHVELIKSVVLEELRKYWPLDNRRVHYALLNHSFYRNTREQLRYQNDDHSYDATNDLLTRLRLRGEIPWEALEDITRPTKEYRAFANVREFIAFEGSQFLTGYWRDYLQSQPNFIQVLVEKNTVKHMADMVCEKYQVPSASARGFNGIDSLYRISQKFHASGKSGMKLIMLADYDPEGERLTNNAGITLRDEFGINDVKVFKCGVTREQIEKYKLPEQNFAKDSSANLPWFLDRTGGNPAVYELEALHPEDMMRDLDKCIRGVIDLDLYNAEVEAEQQEAVELERAHRIAQQSLKDLI